jgi:hypothetical protein
VATQGYPKVFELNCERLGRMLLNVAPVAAGLGHKQPRYTLKDYTHPNGDLEMHFIKDLFTLTTEEIADRWYGGINHAAAFAMFGANEEK